MTDRYAVFGNPISHSKSPFIHNGFARQTGQDLLYEAIEAPSDGFAAALTEFRRLGGKGANVTAPFKLEAFAMATDPSPGAKLAGAANAFRFEGDRIFAENFDGVGLMRDITANLGVPLTGLRVLLMGAGGAARGAMLPLLEKRPCHLTVVNRTVSKLPWFVSQFSPFGKFETCGYDELGEQSFDVVLNATSASLRKELPPITGKVFAGCGLAYDLAYGHGLTPFLALARQTGVKALADGVGMLVEQAAEGFLFWRGVRPDTGDAIKALRVPLRYV